MLTDGALLERYARYGDADAFAELGNRYSGLVFSACFRITGNAEDAKDASQECFLELARNAGRIRSSLPSWLHKVARNKATDVVRRTCVSKQREEEAAVHNRSREESDWPEIACHIDEAIERLPGSIRLTLILHYLQGKTQDEVSRELGVTQATVSRRLDQGIEGLRKHLRKAGLTVPASALAGLLAENSASAVPVALTAAIGKMAIAGIGSGGASAAAGGAAVSAIAGISAFVGTAVGKTVAVTGAAAVLAGVGFGVHNSILPSPESLQSAQATLEEYSISIASVTDEELVVLARDGCGNALNSIRSGQGKFIVSRWSDSGGHEMQTEARGEVAFSGNRLKLTVATTYLKNKVEVPLGAGIVPVGTVIMNEGMSDGETAVWYRPDREEAIITLPSSNPLVGTYEADIRLLSHGYWLIPPNAEFVLREDFRSSNCIVLDLPIDTSGVPGTVQVPLATTRLWIDPNRNFVVPLYRVLVQENGDYVLTREGVTEFREVGGLWVPIKSTLEDYELTADGDSRKSRIRITEWDPDFEWNVELRDSDLTFSLPSGTTVRDRLRNKDYTQP